MTESIAKTLPPKGLHEELNCLSYFGFGGGYAQSSGHSATSVESDDRLYCNICPVGQDCWEAHKKRCMVMFPDLVKAMEQMVAEGLRGSALLQMCHDEFGTEPYTAVMAGNVEDGLAVGLGWQPKDRGMYSLPWPFRRLA